jgi:hypothetical protein
VNSLFRIDWRTTEAYGTPPELYTGDKILQPEGGFSPEDSLIVTGNDPLPCTVRALIPRIEITGSTANRDNREINMSFTALLTAGGIGLQAFGAYRQAQYAEAQAKAQAGMMRYNQQVAEQNAKAIEAKTTFDQLRELRRGKKRMGRLRARLGASGVLMDEGAPANILAEQAYENALETALVGYEGRVAASRQRAAGTLYGAQAGIYGQQAKSYRQAGRLGVGTTLLTGFSRMGQKGMLEGTPFGSWWS